MDEQTTPTTPQTTSNQEIVARIIDRATLRMQQEYEMGEVEEQLLNEALNEAEATLPFPEGTTESVRWAEVDEGVYSANGINPLVYGTYNRAARRSMQRRGISVLQDYEGYDTIEEEQPRKEFNVSSKTRNKALAEWSISARALRELINELISRGQNVSPDDFVTVYKFGAVFNRRYRRWFIYNKGTRNNIATLKMSGDKPIVRYRPNAFYTTVFEELDNATKVESENLHRHNRIVGGNYDNYINNNANGLRQFRMQKKDEDARKHNR